MNNLIDRKKMTGTEFKKNYETFGGGDLAIQNVVVDILKTVPFLIRKKEKKGYIRVGHR